MLRRFVELQYRRNDQSFTRGAFRVRGDLVEIFPAHYEDRGWRLSLFGDEIESIHEFDPLTGEKTGELEQVTVYPNSHYVTPKPTLQQATKGIKRNSRYGWPSCRRKTSCSKPSALSSARSSILR